jgi:hypothetical protein
LLTTPSGPITLADGATTLLDVASLTGGSSPTGDILFTLTGPNGVIYTNDVPVNHSNGRYFSDDPGTSTGSSTLSTTTSVIGTYTWTVHYSGDASNNPADDEGGAAEQTVVSPAKPTLVTAAFPSTRMLGETATGLGGVITMSGAYFPTGNINIALKLGSTTVATYTETAANGDFRELYFLPTTGCVTGTYTWTASYAGDCNNDSATDPGGAAEQTVVSPAQPTLVTAAFPSIRMLGETATALGGVITMSGAYFPTGNINIALKLGSTTVATYTETAANGEFRELYALPTTGCVTGTYTWTASYNLDGSDCNNDSAADPGGPTEQTVVSPGQPTLTTTASPAITLDASGAPTISDTITMSGAYFPTSNINVTLKLGSTTVATFTPAAANGTITETYTLPTTGSVTGTYTWSASYNLSGNDCNNGSATDQGGTTEQTVVSQARPTIVTTANPTGTVNVGDTAITVSDAAVVSGGYFMTGSLTFKLSGPSGFTPITTTVSLSGTGTGSYAVTDTLLPASSPVGTYTWTVTYAGDANNNSAHDQGGSAEQFTIQNVTARGEAAAIGFWANNNGQALLKTYGSALGNWLGTTYPNLFGNLTGATGTQVAAYFIKLKAANGPTYSTMTQCMSVALGVWVTTTGLGWNTSSTGPMHYGFMQGFGGAGLGSILFNVGSNGASFGVANNTYISVNAILVYFNSKSVRTGGTYTTLPTFVLYGGTTTLQNGATAVLSGINQQGNIGTQL